VVWPPAPQTHGWIRQRQQMANQAKPCSFCPVKEPGKGLGRAAVTHPSQLHDLMAWGGDSSRIVQFSRVITPVEEIQTWNATSYGFSFVISYQSRSGPGLQDNPGFVASWRPAYQNRPAVKVVGSPFKTFAAAEQACELC
jgi:hypothetical protein